MLDGAALAKKVKALRASTGLTLQQVADRAGCAKSHVWEIEKGKSINPTLRQIGGLCRAFGVSMAEFITEPEPRSQEFMVSIGCDAMRVCLGGAPITHSVEDIIRWIEVQAGSEKIDSASDARTVNNTMRHQYRVLTDAEKASMARIKDMGLEFHEFVSGLGNSRETSLAKTKIEEAVMWAVKHVTG